MSRFATPTGSLVCCPPNNGFPVQAEVVDAFMREVGALPGGNALVRKRPFVLYHRRNVSNTGDSQLIFFNENRQRGVTNMDQASLLPANYMFAIHTMRFNWLYGINNAGSRTAVVPTTGDLLKTCLSRGSIAGANADLLAVVWKAAEQTRAMLSQGIVTFTVSEQPVFEVVGLDAFPAGRGVVPQFAATSAVDAQAAPQTSADIVGNLMNGAPIMGNCFPFGSPWPLVAGQSFKVTVDYPTLIDWTNATIGPLNGETAGAPAGTLECSLWGALYTPGTT